MNGPRRIDELSRRTFLGLCAAIVAAISVRRGVTARPVAQHRSPEATGRDFDIAGDHPSLSGLDGIAAVGLAYLALEPTEASVASLRESIGAHASDEPGRLAKPSQSAIERDFRDADVVNLDGWRLSRTEARFAALLYLERESSG